MHNHKFCGHFVSETHALSLFALFVLLHQPPPATASCNKKTREPSIRLIDRTNQTTPKLIQSTMPTHQQITAARERGAEADALMEDLLVAIQHHHHHHQQQQQQQQPPPLPPQNTAGMANLYTAGYGGENQEPEAVQDPPAVESRTG
jgi:hypothetical protein